MQFFTLCFHLSRFLHCFANLAFWLFFPIWCSCLVSSREQQLCLSNSLQHDPLQQGALYGENPQQNFGPLPGEEVQPIWEVHHVSFLDGWLVNAIILFVCFGSIQDLSLIVCFCVFNISLHTSVSQWLQLLPFIGKHSHDDWSSYKQ